MGRTAAPNRIIVAGDWHGNTAWALDVIGRAGELLAGEEHRVILHLGDFGLWPGDDGHEYICDVALALAEADASLWFVDGNHEDHDQLRHDLGSGLAIPMGPDCTGTRSGGCPAVTAGNGMAAHGWLLVVRCRWTGLSGSRETWAGGRKKRSPTRRKPGHRGRPRGRDGHA